METAIVQVGGPGEVLEAQDAECAGFQVRIVLKDGKAKWISLASVSQSLPGIERTGSWQRFIGSKAVVNVRYKGKVFPAECIPRKDFFNAALSHPQAIKFREAVSEILDRLDESGFVVNPKFANDPLMQIATTAMQTVVQVLELREKVQELEAAQSRIEHKADDAYNMAETAIELQTKYRGRLIAIAELGRRGYSFSQELWIKIGMELRAISLRIGDDPAKFKRPWNGLNVNTYREEIFDTWERESGPKYQDCRKKK